MPNITIPPEWAPMKAVWTAFPSHGDLWQENLAPAQAEVAGLIKALASEGEVHVLVMGDEAIATAKKMLPTNINLIPANFGDIWLRDTGPVFVKDGDSKVAVTFRFNGWGGKYVLPHDDEVSTFIAKTSNTPMKVHDFILEGGSIEQDGMGTFLTTRECLLNPNRNKGCSQTDVEHQLKASLGAKRIVWLDSGLVNDHTDGHIDNLARFIAPGRVLCQKPSGANDPNTETLDAIARTLEMQGFEVTHIPSPGLIEDEEGKPVAASHMNYIIFNHIIVLPTYEERYGEEAAAHLRKVFPNKRVVALPARHVLTGGGSFHCITQQEFV